MSVERGERMVRIVRDIDTRSIGSEALSALENAVIMTGHELPDGSIVAVYPSSTPPLKREHQQYVDEDDGVEAGVHFEGDF